jgi:hypothetical protein
MNLAENDIGHQSPTSGKTVETFADALGIVMHPAFRIGFLDARASKPFDHEKIRARIEAETPPRAFDRLGLSPIEMADPHWIETAQYRYEEGRLLFIIERLKIKAWGHPDYPPAAIYDYLRKRFAVELTRRAEQIRAELDARVPSIVDVMRQRPAQRHAEELPMFKVSA